MSDFENDIYADRAQGISLDQSLRGRLDKWGNPVRPESGFFHDYDTREEVAARRARDAAERRKLASRIQAAMAQMEKICPPKERAA